MKQQVHNNCNNDDQDKRGIILLLSIAFFKSHGNGGKNSHTVSTIDQIK